MRSGKSIYCRLETLHLPPSKALFLISPTKKVFAIESSLDWFDRGYKVMQTWKVLAELVV